MDVLFVIAAVIFVIAMTWVSIRNARALKRDVDKRFEDLGARLAREAQSTLAPLLERDIGDKPG